MSPSRSRRSSSRRSSILKPAKPRQALQNLNVHSSSNENSPATTSKFKRRVSFAEKKHVKEFCNSVEQGTVWDATYEEHDLSHLKIPGTVNQEEHDVQTIHKENIISCNQDNNMQLVFNERIEKDLSIKGSDLSSTNTIDGTENRDFLLTQTKLLINSSNKSHNVQVQRDKPLENDNYEKLCDESSEFSQLNLNSFNPNNLNAISIQDVCMEFTEVVCHAEKHDINYIQHGKVKERFHNATMEFTQPIFSTINMLQNFQQEQNSEKLDPRYGLNKSNVTLPDQNASMELTVAVPSIIKAIDNVDKAELSVHSVSNRTKRFDNMSMEITVPVPSVPSVLDNLQRSAANNEIESCDLDFTGCINNKTTTFHDVSMEITNVVQIKANKDTNYQSEFDRLTATEKTDFRCENEKTNLLDTSMEMTKAIPNNIHSIAESQQRKEKRCDTTDASVENSKKIRSDVDYYKTLINLEKTKIYNTEAMEFTEVVTTSPEENVTNSTPVLNSSSNDDDKDDSIKMASDKTISQNSSMIITKVISPFCPKDNCEQIINAYESDINNQESDKTALYPNTSMEITEAVIVSQCHVPLKNPVINATYVKESVLVEAGGNKSTDSINCPNVSDNVFKNITNTIVPSPSKSDLITEKEMQVANDLSQCLKENATKASVSAEIENSVNISSNVILLESKQQESEALPLKENIQEKTYVLHSPLLCNPPNITTVEINQNECSSHKQFQNVISNPRRTYTIHPLSIDHSSDQENAKTNDNIDNKINNEINCSNGDLNHTDNLQNNDREYSLEQDAIFFNNPLEELHTITPPSFLCLDDLSDSDTSVDVHTEANTNSDNNERPGTTEQENILENKCNLENVSNAREETLKMDQVIDVQIDKINENCSDVDLRPNVESHDSFEEKDASIELDPFSSLMKILKVCAQSDEIIWEVYHENIERNLFVIGFISSSLLVVIYLNDRCDLTGDQLVKEIKIYSRLADDADALISIVHRIIIEKLDAQVLTDLCKNCQDILSILDHISKEVKLAMDFMFDVERISDVNLMEITRDSISFIAFARRKDIILRVTIAIKPFHKIESEDISVQCTVGSVSEENVKRLITNVKRDHKFLRRFINDVNDYIYLMEESANTIKR